MMISASECIPIEYIKDQIEEYRKFDHLGMYAEFLDMFIQDYKDNAMANYADRKTEPMIYPQVDGITPSVITQTEPQLAEKCPFDDSLPCEWVCTEYGKCKYKKWDAPPKVELTTGEITTCVSVLASALEDEPDCLTCRYNSDEWDSPKCDGCSKAHSNYEPQTEGSE